MQPVIEVITRQDPITFFCHACLEDKPVSDISPDPRYCQFCCDFLIKEAQALSPGRHPKWVPEVQNNQNPGYYLDHLPTLPAIKPCQKNQCQVSEEGAGILSTLGKRKIKDNRIEAQADRRGRKKKSIPKDFINQLHRAGLGAKAIATKLKVERGIHISYKTIQRNLIDDSREVMK